MIGTLPRLHAVTDDRVLREHDVVAKAAAMAAAAGPALAVHLRSRELSGEAMLALARELAAALAPHQSWLVVNDRADVARASGARAVVSGRGGLSVADARKTAPAALVGRSVHDAAQTEAARRESADFLVAGAVFPTTSHPDRHPAGLALVTNAASGGRPVIAIGGLTAERTGETIAAGAYGVAAIRALWDAGDVAARVTEFLAALPAMGTVNVAINGEARSARAGISLAQLLTELALDPRAVVVEHNRRIVRRDALADARLAEGDSIELVHFVGGG